MNLLAQQEQFEQQLFPKANKLPKTKQKQQQSIDDQRKPENKKLFDQEKTIDESGRSANFLYNMRQSYPVVEYLPAEEESASLTPSFVLEVTWPRIIQFYHPASPHCQSFQPVYVSVARGIKRRSSRMPVEFHAVNCGVHREVCEQGFDVRSVPMIIGLKSGRIDWTEISLPGSINAAASSPKNDLSTDFELKVEYLARVMEIPLDSVKVAHTDGGMVKKGMRDSSRVISERIGAVIAPANEHGPSSTSSRTHIPLFDQVYHDAMASLIVTLTTSLVSQYTPDSPLPADVSRALSEFLDLIRWAYPPESRVHDLAEDLRLDFSSAIASKEGLLAVISRHVDLEVGITWSARCGTESNGRYECGIWSLLHILSIGVAERHTSVVGVAERVSVFYAGQVMRTFIDKFFVGRSSCRDIWIQLYDDTCCALHSNDNSQLKNVNGGKVDEWRSLAIWIWEIHNDVTVRRDRLAGISYDHKLPRMAPLSSLWPTKEECPKCWQSLTDDTGVVMSMDSYDRNQLFDYLKKIYWPSGIHNNRLIVLDRWNNAKRALSTRNLRARMTSHDWPICMLFFLISLFCFITRVCLCFVRRRVTRGGYRSKRSIESSQQSDELDWNRNSHHSAALKSRCRQTIHTLEQPVPKRYDNREEEFHHNTTKISQSRPHEGKRRCAGPGSKSVKKNRYNYT